MESIVVFCRRSASSRVSIESFSRSSDATRGSFDAARATAATLPAVPPLPVPTAVPDVPLPDLPVAAPTAVPSAVPTAVPTVGPNPLAPLTDDIDKLIQQINQFAFPVTSGAPAPPCKKQGPFNFGGDSSQYPHVKSK